MSLSLCFCLGSANPANMSHPCRALAYVDCVVLSITIEFCGSGSPHVSRQHLCHLRVNLEGGRDVSTRDTHTLQDDLIEEVKSSSCYIDSQANKRFQLHDLRPFTALCHMHLSSVHFTTRLPKKSPHEAQRKTLFAIYYIYIRILNSIAL